MNPDYPAIAAPISPNTSSLFVVCGLGSVGQNCVTLLHAYGATVNAINEMLPVDWEVPELPGAIATLVVGDCRKPEILEQAQVRGCRAVLCVTNDERSNTETAFAVRLLNPTARILVRSSKQNLNHFLAQSLGDFIALEPTDLSASAFAFAALGSEVLGYFKLENQLLRVVQAQVKVGDRWCDRSVVRSLNTSHRRVLCHVPANSAPTPFYAWDREAVLRAGDTLVYVELTDRVWQAGGSRMEPRDRGDSEPSHQKGRAAAPLRSRVWWKSLQNIHWRQWGQQLWQAIERDRPRQVAVLSLGLILLLLFIGVLLLRWQHPEISWRETFSATFSLLLGGYPDIFGGLNPEGSSTTWLAMILGIVLTLAGTAFIGVLYALLTESLLTARFQFFNQRPPIPTRDHVVLIGLNRLGERVAHLLQELKQPVVGVNHIAVEPTLLPTLPMVTGTLSGTLEAVHLPQAKSAVIVLEDDLDNLELGLMIHAAHPECDVVLRTQDPLFSRNIERLFPYAQVLCAPAVAAEVFAAAAYGERVLSLFHLAHQTILVTEYTVTLDDTLNGLLLAEMAYGYGVVPLLHQRNTVRGTNFMPSEDIRLEEGDRVIVLATSKSLQRIERGELGDRQWQVYIDQALTRDAVFEGANEITRIAGYGLSASRQLMASLPAILPTPLYQHQAQRLIRHLSKVQVTAHLRAIAPTKSQR